MVISDIEAEFLESDDDMDHYKEMARILKNLKGETGIQIEHDEQGVPIFRTGNKVGHIQYTSKTGGTKTLIIQPKIPDSATGMLATILEEKFDKAFQMKERSVTTLFSPSAWIATMYLDRLENFLNNIRPRGEEREQEFHGKVRGKILMSQYLKRNYLTRRQFVPCRYLDWTMDNLPNQILKYALELSQRTIANSSNQVFQNRIGVARRCAGPLAGVSLMRISQEDFIRVKSLLAGPFRPYREIVNLAGLLISNIDPFSFDGEEVRQGPLVDLISIGETSTGLRWDLVNMPNLFEAYLRYITGGEKASIELEMSANPEWDLDQKKRIEPDCLVHHENRTYVLDGKYKQIFDDNQPRARVEKGGDHVILQEWTKWITTEEETNDEHSESRKKCVSSADVYQVAAYATHKDIKSDFAGLVYPCGNSEDDSDTAILIKNLGFSHESSGDSDEQNGIDVRLLTLRIDKEGIQNEIKRRTSFLEHLKSS